MHTEMCLCVMWGTSAGDSQGFVRLLFILSLLLWYKRPTELFSPMRNNCLILGFFRNHPFIPDFVLGITCFQSVFCTLVVQTLDVLNPSHVFFASLIQVFLLWIQTVLYVFTTLHLLVMNAS